NRSGATGKKRCQNCARTADEQFAVLIGAKHLRFARTTCPASRGNAQLEPVRASRTESVSARRPLWCNKRVFLCQNQERTRQRPGASAGERDGQNGQRFAAQSRGSSAMEGR